MRRFVVAAYPLLRPIRLRVVIGLLLCRSTQLNQRPLSGGYLKLMNDRNGRTVVIHRRCSLVLISTILRRIRLSGSIFQASKPPE